MFWRPRIGVTISKRRATATDRFIAAAAAADRTRDQNRNLRRTRREYKNSSRWSRGGFFPVHECACISFQVPNAAFSTEPVFASVRARFFFFFFSLFPALRPLPSCDVGPKTRGPRLGRPAAGRLRSVLIKTPWTGGRMEEMKRRKKNYQLGGRVRRKRDTFNKN